jgi:transcription elongation factor Elf1
MDFYPPSYHKNPNLYKRFTITNWKKRGVIYHNLDELYEVYINTMNCQHCGKEYKNSSDRCLDHDHETGMFRKIVCRNCNNQDCYLKYPLEYTTFQKRKEYKKKWHDERKVLKRQGFKTPRFNCFFCNKEMAKYNLTKHYKLGACPMIKPK